jgi:hypothetical protein
MRGTSFALLLALALNVPAIASPAWATGFLDAVEDMPLMEGLTETGEGGIIFDKPTGRIVRTIATGAVTSAAVRSFYADTLPQLGWTRYPNLELIKDLMIFKREDERLHIQTVSHFNGKTEVRFSIEPD